MESGKWLYFLLGLVVGIVPLLWSESTVLSSQARGKSQGTFRTSVMSMRGGDGEDCSRGVTNAPRVADPPPRLPTLTTGGALPGLSFAKWRAENAALKFEALDRGLRSILTNDWASPKNGPDPEFNVTSHMVRRARTVVGNTHRFRGLVKRIQGGHCIRVMILGGSVSHGYNVGGHEKSWGSSFMRWLNLAHPCSSGMAGRHEVLYRTVGGAGTVFAVNNWDHLVRPGTQNVDMIVVEYAVNDGFMGEQAHLDYTDEVFKQQWFTEALIRRCLRYRNLPDGTEPPAIVYLEAGFKGKGFMSDMAHGRATEDFARSVPSSSHYPLLQYYQIPTVSFTDVILPMMLVQRECPTIDPRWGCSIDNPYWSGTPFSFYIGNNAEHNGMFTDVCCHPRSPSHAFMAILMGFTLDDEASYMASSSDAPLHDWEYERDATRDGDGSMAGTKLPALLKLTPDEDRWVVGTNALFAVSFGDLSNPTPEDAYGVQPAVAMAPGWSLYADSKDKLGLIATSPWSHISVRLTLGASTKAARITVGYLRSYDNISATAYWINDRPGLGTAEADKANPDKCDPAFAAGLDWLDPCAPSTRETVYDAYHIPLDKVSAPVLYLHVCLAPFGLSRVPTRDDDDVGKFKLLSVMGFPVGVSKAGKLLGRMATAPAPLTEKRLLARQDGSSNTTALAQCPDGCGWTLQYSCPGQPRGIKGPARDDGSESYRCCCGPSQSWRAVAPASPDR